MTQAANPFAMVYRALGEMLWAHAPLAALVRQGNRVVFAGGSTGDRSPLKDQVAAGDLPELRLVPAGGTTWMLRTSSSGTVAKRFQIQVATGEQLLDDPAGLYEVEWEVLRAMHGWPAKLQALLYDGHKFVVDCSLADAIEGINAADLNRGIRGWSCVWACEVVMAFATADLLPVAADE